VAESEGCHGLGRIAGVVAAGGGDVVVACLAEQAGQVPQVAMTCGPLRVRTWEASSA